MTTERSVIRRQAEYVLDSLSPLHEPPKVAVVLGSGLGSLFYASRLRGVKFENIPQMPEPSAPGHSGELNLHSFQDRFHFWTQSGRLHLYDGHSAEKAVRPIRLLAELGIERLILCGAVGGLRKAMKPGMIVAVNDHINLTGTSPLLGPRYDPGAPPYPDMIKTYDPEWRTHTQNLAWDLFQQEIHAAKYGGVLGPQLETEAEYDMLRIVGADVVGMSTVIEAIAARQLGIKVLALSVITDTCFPPYPHTTAADIEASMAKARGKLSQLLLAVLERCYPPIISDNDSEQQ